MASGFDPRPLSVGVEFQFSVQFDDYSTAEHTAVVHLGQDMKNAAASRSDRRRESARASSLPMTPFSLRAQGGRCVRAAHRLHYELHRRLDVNRHQPAGARCGKVIDGPPTVWRVAADALRTFSLVMLGSPRSVFPSQQSTVLASGELAHDVHNPLSGHVCGVRSTSRMGDSDLWVLLVAHGSRSCARSTI